MARYLLITADRTDFGRSRAGDHDGPARRLASTLRNRITVTNFTGRSIPPLDPKRRDDGGLPVEGRALLDLVEFAPAGA